MDNPHYVDYYHLLHDKILIYSDKDSHFSLPHDSYNGDIFPYKNEDLKRFHLFKVNESSWNEVKLDLAELESNGFMEWECFASGIIGK